MQAEFRIVWIDDSPDWVEPVEDAIRDYIESLDFVPVVDKHADGRSITESQPNDDADLYVIDFQLPGINGDEIIQWIRDRKGLTDIVFYSQNADTKQILRDVDGLYKCARDDAEEMLCKVIFESTKKLSDLSIYRGRIIAEIIDLENLIESIIAEMFAELGVFVHQRFFGNPVMMDFGKKAMIIQCLLKDALQKCGDNGKASIKKELEVIRDCHSNFFEDIIHQRNALAHARPLKRDDGSIYLEPITKSRKVEITSDWRAEMRASITKHRENLESLRSIMPELRPILVDA